MNKEERIKELLDLMNIPEFEKLITIKMDELKIILAKKVKSYYTLKKELQKSDGEGMDLLDGSGPGEAQQSFFFELNRVADEQNTGEYRWLLKKIEPRPEGPIDDVIPPAIFEKIGSHAANPTKIVFDTYESKEMQQEFDIKSIKHSDTRVFGTIRTSRQNKKSKHFRLEDQRNTITVKIPREKVESEKKYTELFRYMEKYPEIKEQIFANFFLVQKPFIDHTETLPPARSKEVMAGAGLRPSFHQERD